MNKEELLKHLTELQKRLDSEVDTYNIDTRVEEIEKINEQLEKNKTMLKYNTEKLADDKNFADETPLQYYLMLEAQELENLKSKQLSERENEDRILSEESIIAISEATIFAGEEEIAKLADDNVHLNIDIRRARLSSNQAKIEACEKKIASNEARTNDITLKNEEIRKSIEEHKSVIESLTGLKENLSAQTIEAQAKYDDVVNAEKASKTGAVDLAKKNKVEAEVETLNSINNALDQRSAAISYNYAGEMANILNDYQNSSINEEEVKARLIELKGKLPKDFLSSDEATRNNEIANNKRSQEIVEVKVDELTRRLANEENYKLSPAEHAKIRAKVSNFKATLGSYESQIAILSPSYRTENENKVTEYRELINLCDEENEELSRQLIFNNGVDAELEKELTEKQQLNFTIIAEAKEEIETIKTEMIENDQVLAQLQDRKARLEKLIESNSADLNNANAIDKSKMRLDQIALAANIQGLNALKNREKYLNNSIAAYIDGIVNNNLDLTDAAIDNNVSNSNIPFPMENGVNPEDLNLLNNSDENMKPISVGTVNPENNLDDNSPSELGPDDEDLELLGVENPDSLSPDDKDLELLNVENPEDDKIEEISTSDVNEKLREKSKSIEFKAALKKYWKRIALVVTIIVVLVGLKSCDSNNVKHATDNVINNPSAVEEITNSPEPEKSLEDFMKNNGLSLDDDAKTNDSATSTDDKSKDSATDSTTDKKDDNGKKTEAAPTSKPTPSVPYTETAPTITETPAAPVDPSTIVDEHPDNKIPHQNPVDPSTIVDEHPSTDVVIPPETPDQGTHTSVDGVSGNETVPDNAWNNDNSVSGNTATPTPSTGGVSGNETVPDNAWDNETPVITGSSTGSTTTVVNTPVVNAPATTTPEKTVTIAVQSGDALIMDNNNTTYVADNGSNYQAPAAALPEIASPDVQSVSVMTDETGENTINVEVNSSAAVRDTALTDTDVANISKENDINQDEIAKIEAQFKAQQAALEEMKQQVQSSQTTATEQTVSENTAGISK